MGSKIFLVFLLLFETSAFAKVGLENLQGAMIQTRDLHFVNEEGQAVLLDRYFHSTRPVLMALVFFECPGICTVLLNELIAGMKQMMIEPGSAFEVVVVSIDPEDTARVAKSKMENYLEIYGRPGTASGWHFLTGRAEDISSLSQQLGFQFEKDQKTGLFVHPSALFFLTPEGILSRTLSGTRFSGKILRLALVDAAGGRVGTLFDRFSSICYAYLPHFGWLNRPIRWFFVFASLTLFALIGMAIRAFFPKRCLD